MCVSSTMIEITTYHDHTTQETCITAYSLMCWVGYILTFKPIIISLFVLVVQFLNYTFYWKIYKFKWNKFILTLRFKPPVLTDSRFMVVGSFICDTCSVRSNFSGHLQSVAVALNSK